MNLDRTNHIGASDTHYVMAGWHTKKFQNFWSQKLGITPQPDFSNKYTQAGTMLEEHIVNSVNQHRHIQIIKPLPIEKGIVRVHLDGVHKDTIYEIKTTKWEKWMFEKLNPNYRSQCMVQMYVSGMRNCFVVLYGMNEHEYNMDYWLCPRIDYSRIKFIPIVYKPEYIEKYKRRIEILTRCHDEKRFPTEQEIKCLN